MSASLRPSQPTSTQRIKGMYDRGDNATSVGRKAVLGALSLYLNFILQPVRDAAASFMWGDDGRA